MNRLCIITISIWPDCCARATIVSSPQAIRLSLEQALPPEPEGDSGEQISKLRIRTPSGEFLERRFLGSCKLQVLFDFVASKGYPFEEFKLLTTFPRRNVSNLWPLLDLCEEYTGYIEGIFCSGWATFSTGGPQWLHKFDKGVVAGADERRVWTTPPCRRN